MKVYYTATAKFNPITQRSYQGLELNWNDYVTWSKLMHLNEVISLDSLLCPVIVEMDYQRDADFLVWEDFFPDVFTNLQYLLNKLEEKDPGSYNLLAVIKEPNEPCEAVYQKDFDFIGYDLLDVYGSISALTNCGGFDETFSPTDLNEYGLISTFSKAYKIREELKLNNPDEVHANCYVWAIWRMNKDEE